MVRQADVVIVELKRCPRCEESLPLSEFGLCRARKDGLNLYCKRCIRQKIALSRQALREYKNARSKHGVTAGSSRSRVTIEAKLAFYRKRIARMLGSCRRRTVYARPFAAVRARKKRLPRRLNCLKMRFATPWRTFCSGPAKFAPTSSTTRECISLMR